jgi:subtilase family serine protease
MAAAPGGYNPADLQSAYKLPSATAGSGQTVAIVDAYNDPRAESDLGVYRSQFGLPACTTANGCFKKVDQNGGTSYPRGNTGWAEEISLDLDMVSAICPNCHILLVEAKTNSFANLATAVNTAARLGANAISNSYGGSEYSNEVTDQSNFNHPGVAITASSGDNGYGVEFPAASQYVTAVGGTSLTRSGNSRGWSETAWSGAGSGCSAYISKPSWQRDSGCSRRTVADVSAVADPNTGVSVYDTYNTSGWLVFGGTSVASPIIASVYALAGNEGSITYGSYPYSHTSSLFDVTSGSNGSCGGSYLCTATTGYDGPTGLGTPNGSGGF